MSILSASLKINHLFHQLPKHLFTLLGRENVLAVYLGKWDCLMFAHVWDAFCVTQDCKIPGERVVYSTLSAVPRAPTLRASRTLILGPAALVALTRRCSCWRVSWGCPLPWRDRPLPLPPQPDPVLHVDLGNIFRDVPSCLSSLYFPPNLKDHDYLDFLVFFMIGTLGTGYRNTLKHT